MQIVQFWILFAFFCNLTRRILPFAYRAYLYKVNSVKSF